MARKQFFVSPDGIAWKVTSEGSTLSRHSTKAEARRNAIDRAHNHKGDAQVLIQGQNGQFQTEWTYGHDPYPPKG